MDARKWKELLDSHNIDGTAQHALFLLGSRDHLGWAHANGIISKVQAKKIGELRDPSSYVHTCVGTARTEIGKAMQGMQPSTKVSCNIGGFYKPTPW